jgi:hypothetical protein
MWARMTTALGITSQRSDAENDAEEHERLEVAISTAASRKCSQTMLVKLMHDALGSSRRPDSQLVLTAEQGNLMRKDIAIMIEKHGAILLTQYKCGKGQTLVEKRDITQSTSTDARLARSDIIFMHGKHSSTGLKDRIEITRGLNVVHKNLVSFVVLIASEEQPGELQRREIMSKASPMGFRFAVVTMFDNAALAQT